MYPTSNNTILSNASTNFITKVFTYGSENTRLIYFPDVTSNYAFIVKAINQAGYSLDSPSLYTFLNVGFTPPTEFGQLALWLDASLQTNIQTSGANLVSIIGRTTPVVFNQASIARSLPFVSSISSFGLNSLQTILFSNSGLKQTSTFINVKHMFFVGRQAASASFNFILGHDSTADWHGGPTSYIGSEWAPDNIKFAPSQILVNGAAPYTTTWAGNIPLIRGRPFIYNVNPYAENTRFQGIGFDRNYGSDRGWNGDFAELLVYTSSMTNDQISSVNGYLANKWFPNPSNFSPSSIGGCLFWIDTSKPNGFTMTGSNVTTIRDFSQFSNSLTLVPSGGFTNPLFGSSINSLSTVRVGSGRALRVNSTINGTRHLFWVGRQASNAEFAFTFLFGSDTDYAWHGQVPSYNRFIDGNAYTNVREATSYMFINNGDYRQSVFTDMTLPNCNSVFLLSLSTSGPNTPFQGITYDRSQSPRGWTGDLGEVICYTSSLTIQQQEEVEGYLRRKWGILPAPIRSPTQLSSLQLWLDATDPNGNGTIPTQSTTITSWKDKSGFNRHAESVSNNNYYISTAISRRPSISFTRDSWYRGTISPTYTGKPWYTFTVASGNTDLNGTYARLYAFGASNTDDYGDNRYFGVLRGDPNANQLGIYRNGQQNRVSYSPTSPSAIPNAFLITTIFDGTSLSKVRLNGITLSESNVQNVFDQNLSISHFTVGASPNPGDSGRWAGFISEHIAYSNLTLDEVESVEAYLKQKWLV